MSLDFDRHAHLGSIWMGLIILGVDPLPMLCIGAADREIWKYWSQNNVSFVCMAKNLKMWPGLSRPPCVTLPAVCNGSCLTKLNKLVYLSVLGFRA